MKLKTIKQIVFDFLNNIKVSTIYFIANNILFPRSVLFNMVRAKFYSLYINVGKDTTIGKYIDVFSHELYISDKSLEINFGKGVVISDHCCFDSSIGHIKIDDLSLLYKNCNLKGPVKNGKKCLINTNCYIRPNTTIGNNVALGPNVKIISDSHEISEGERSWGKQTHLPIVIKDGVWIGCNSIVLGGVTIGEKTVVGAGSIVTKDLPSNTLCVCTPAKIIREF